MDYPKPLVFVASSRHLAAQAAIRVRAAIGWRRFVRWVVVAPDSWGDGCSIGPDVWPEDYDVAVCGACVNDGDFYAQVASEGGAVIFLPGEPPSPEAWSRFLDEALGMLANLGVEGAAKLLPWRPEPALAA